jgi:peptidoglycan hydrolase CwlO-like protein
MRRIRIRIIPTIIFILINISIFNISAKQPYDTKEKYLKELNTIQQEQQKVQEKINSIKKEIKGEEQ